MSGKIVAATVIMVVASAFAFTLCACDSHELDSVQAKSASATVETASVSNVHEYIPVSITMYNDDVEFELDSTNGWAQDDKAYIQFNVNVENLGDAVDSWELNVPFNGDLSVSSSWGCVCDVDGSVLTIRNDGYNGSLDKGEFSKGVGFIVCGASNLGIFM